VIHTFAKNALDEVVAYIQPYQGRQLAHIRLFTPGGDDEMRPTKQGIAVQVSDLPKLAAAVSALCAAARTDAE
jgi:hypothetical protein